MKNKINENKVLYCKALRCETIKNNKKVVYLYIMSHVEYHSREYKHDIKESKGNMFNPINKENVQGRKCPWSCAFAEPELLM